MVSHFQTKTICSKPKKHTIEFSNNTPPQDTTTHPQQARRSPPDSHHSEPTTTSTAPLQGPSPRRLIQLYTPPSQHATRIRVFCNTNRPVLGVNKLYGGPHTSEFLENTRNCWPVGPLKILTKIFQHSGIWVRQGVITGMAAHSRLWRSHPRCDSK